MKRGDRKSRLKNITQMTVFTSHWATNFFNSRLKFSVQLHFTFFSSFCKVDFKAQLNNKNTPSSSDRRVSTERKKTPAFVTSQRWDLLFTLALLRSSECLSLSLTHTLHKTGWLYLSFLFGVRQLKACCVYVMMVMMSRVKHGVSAVQLEMLWIS